MRLLWYAIIRFKSFFNYSFNLRQFYDNDDETTITHMQNQTFISYHVLIRRISPIPNEHIMIYYSESNFHCCHQLHIILCIRTWFWLTTYRPRIESWRNNKTNWSKSEWNDTDWANWIGKKPPYIDGPLWCT